MMGKEEVKEFVNDLSYEELEDFEFYVSARLMEKEIEREEK
jgi:hypothetical protein